MGVRIVMLITLLLGLWGCSRHQALTNSESQLAAAALPINYALFQQQESIVESDTLFLLSEEHQQDFLADFNYRLSRGVRPHIALSEFLETRLDNFTFYGATYVADQAWSLNKGNCMSLAMLTTALAQLVDLEIDYREVNTLPVFEKNNNLLLSSTHVQTRVFEPSQEKNNHISYTRANVVVDYFPVNTNYAGKHVNSNQFIAMYYRNKAADALILDDINLAFSYTMQAYEHAPQDIEVLNLLAVLHRRQGDVKTAEDIYLFGLQVNPNSLSLLTNYIVLLEKNGRQSLANEYREKMLTLNDPNPYIWLEQAYRAEAAGEQSRAKILFDKTLELAPYVQPAYIGLYRIYLSQGRHLKAKKTLKQALEWSYEKEERQLYKFKLYNLNSESSQ